MPVDRVHLLDHSVGQLRFARLRGAHGAVVHLHAGHFVRCYRGTGERKSGTEYGGYGNELLHLFSPD
jgi:hypothetical protein